jgi:hypothetical protein
MAVFLAHGQAVTENFEAGDVGYAPWELAIISATQSSLSCGS